MADDILLTTDPRRPGGPRNDANNAMNQSQTGGLTTYVNSEEMRTTMDAVIAENRHLQGQIQMLTQAYKPHMAELENTKKINQRLTQQLVRYHSMSKVKIDGLGARINELQHEKEELHKLNHALRKQRATGGIGGGAEGVDSGRGPVLQALKGHMEAVEDILKQELSTGKQGDRENSLLEKLMGHIKKAEEIIAMPEAETFQRSPAAAEGGQVEMGRVTPPLAGRRTSDAKGVASPLSPAGQQSYNQSMDNMLEQLQAQQEQLKNTNSALSRERKHGEELESQLKRTVSELQAMKQAQERSVAAAVEEQRKVDEEKFQPTILDLMTKVDELTLLAADKHQQHAFDEEPRYHSASNELKKQVTSLVAELDHKDRLLQEERSRTLPLEKMTEELQLKVKMYQEELNKARREAQSYIDAIHVELKRKEAQCQSERQKALHEKLQHDKCKDELGSLQARLAPMENERKRFQVDIRGFQMKEDRHLAEMLSAEEAIDAKDKEIKKCEKVVEELKHQVQMWKAQSDVCQRDFQEERKAREVMHAEKLKFQARMEDLRKENRKLEEELQVFHRQKLHEATRGYRAAPQYPAFEGRGGADIYGPRRHTYNMPGDDEAGSEPLTVPEYNPQEMHRPQQATYENWCPKCQQTFPDQDTLMIHIADCID